MYIGSGMRSRSALVLCAVLAVGSAACGGGDGDGAETAAAPQAGSGLEVVAKDIVFEPTELKVGASPTKVTLKNDGAILHTMVIEGAPGFGKLEAAKGATDSGTLDLAPGTYTAYCDQPGHRAAGMEMKLTVG